jgi:hypothetical protein
MNCKNSIHSSTSANSLFSQMNSSNLDACLVVPGQPIMTEPGFLRGHGSFVEEICEGSQLVACVAGQIESVNKLIAVKPLKSRYNVLVKKKLQTGACSILLLKLSACFTFKFADMLASWQPCRWQDNNC